MCFKNLLRKETVTHAENVCIAFGPPPQNLWVDGPMIPSGAGLRRSSETDRAVRRVGAVRNRLRFCKDLWARSLRPQVWQRPHARPCALTHPASSRREWWCLTPTTLGDQPRDADQDYLEPDSEAAGIRLRHRAARGADRRSRADRRHRAASPSSATVRGVWRGGPGV